MCRRFSVGFCAFILFSACSRTTPPVEVGPISASDQCDAIPPYSVDASASEIQCGRDYHYRIEADELLGLSGFNENEQETGVPASSVCCETCALVGNAQPACQERCKYDLCERAQADHIRIARALDVGACQNLVTCGFSMDFCMSTDSLHPQFLVFLDSDKNTSIAVQADCSAYVVESARPDGLFEYIEELDGVPGSQAHGPGSGTDVVQFCIELAGGVMDLPGTGAGGGEGGVPNGADSTGGSSGGDVPLRIPCGPFAPG